MKTTLRYTDKHKELLMAKGYTLRQAQELEDQDNLIHEYLLPLVVSGSEEESEIADDLITMITEWQPGQTEATYEYEDE